MSQQKENFDITNDDIMTLDRCTVADTDTDNDVTESRIVNIDELKEMGVFSFTFCVICQNVATPSRKPVNCRACQSAVFCQECI